MVSSSAPQLLNNSCTKVVSNIFRFQMFMLITVNIDLMEALIELNS